METLNLLNEEKEQQQQQDGPSVSQAVGLSVGTIIGIAVIVFAIIAGLGFVIDKGGGGLILFLILFVVGLLFYFVPTIVAYSRAHRNAHAIFVLNIATGWTFIGWVIAIVWACTSPHAVEVVNVEPKNYAPAPAPIASVNKYFCRQCNALNPETQAFCGSCGFQNL